MRVKTKFLALVMLFAAILVTALIGTPSWLCGYGFWPWEYPFILLVAYLYILLTVLYSTYKNGNQLFTDTKEHYRKKHNQIYNP